MLVGTRNLSRDEIKEASTVASLRKLAIEQVPLLFRHIKEIVDNQKYLIALEVRKMYKGDYNKWHSLCEGLLEGVKVTGTGKYMTVGTQKWLEVKSGGRTGYCSKKYLK